MKESFDRTLKPSKYKKILPYLVLAVLLALSVLVWQFYENYALERAERRYNDSVDSVVNDITGRLHNYEMILMGGAGVFAASEAVTREEWEAYFEYQQKITTLYPGIQSIAVSRVVWPPELAQQIEEIRAEGFPDYTVWPEGEREVYAPVIFVAPFDARNRRAFGYDMFSEPVRRDAMELARDTDAAAITGMVTLVTETDEDSQPGFLMYVPTYAQGMPLNTPEERRAAIEGYVLGAIRIQEMMQNLFPDPLQQDIYFEIYDGAEASPAAPVYDSHVSSDEAGEERKPLFSSQKTLDLYGHQWILVFHSTPAFEAVVDRNTARGILAAGLLVSFLIFFYLQILAATGDRALVLARKMTTALRESEKKYRFLTENVVDVIWTIDLEGRTTYMSPAIENLIGFTLEEAMAMNINEYIVQEDYDALMARLAEELAQPPAEQNRSVIVPARFKTKDKRLVHAEFSAAWLLDEQGNTIGVQGSTRDITERIKTEELRVVSLYTRSLFEVSLDPLVTISAAGKITDVNSAAEEITGFPRKELIGTNFSSYFTEQGRAQAGYEQAFKQGFVRDYPLVICHSSGRTTEVLYNYSVYKDEAGEVQGVFAAARDMTESKMAKQMEERLRQVQALRNIDMAITGSLDLRVTFQVVLDEVTNMLNTDAAAILSLDPHTGTLKYDSWRGFHTKDFKNISLPLGEGHAGRAAADHRAIYVPDLRAVEPDPV